MVKFYEKIVVEKRLHCEKSNLKKNEVETFLLFKNESFCSFSSFKLNINRQTVKFIIKRPIGEMLKK